MNDARASLARDDDAGRRSGGTADRPRRHAATQRAAPVPRLGQLDRRLRRDPVLGRGRDHARRRLAGDAACGTSTASRPTCRAGRSSASRSSRRPSGTAAWLARPARLSAARTRLAEPSVALDTLRPCPTPPVRRVQPWRRVLVRRPPSSPWPPGPSRTPPCTRWPTPCVADAGEILAANAADVAAAEAGGTPAHLVDRLRLDGSRVEAMAQGLRDVAGLPDPVGEVVRGSTLANGLQLRQVRVPFGVVGIIYEARPNVTADAAGICLKSGNAVLLRGSSSARRSNAAIVGVAARRRPPPSGLPGRRRPAGAGGEPRLGQGADARPRPGRRADPARRRRPDPLGGRGVDGAGDRDRRRQLPRLRRRRGRPRHGRADRAQRQDPPHLGVQRRRVAAGAPGRGAASSCRASSAPCRTPG